MNAQSQPSSVSNTLTSLPSGVLETEDGAIKRTGADVIAEQLTDIIAEQEHGG